MSQQLHALVRQSAKMLNHIDKWLEAAVAYADKKKFDPAVLLSSRLAPDAYPLMRQIQVACDSPKIAAARLAGREAPKHTDDPQTLDELRARIREVVAYLEGFTPKDFEGAGERKLVLPFLEGNAIAGSDYVCQFWLPNFYFHVTMVYALLRRDGVELGKRDFIGSLPLTAPPA